MEVPVNIPDCPYRVVIERGVLARVGEHVRTIAPDASRCLLAVDARIARVYGVAAFESLRRANFHVADIEIVANERHKSLTTVEAIYKRMLEGRLDRQSPVVAVGGGIVGDAAGFAAATFMRGVPLVHVPTTLLAMVDASIGGKTGVNHPLPRSGDLGKNLIGAFWQPKIVLCDPESLRTLDARDLRCGLAECIKHGLIADAALLRWIESNIQAIHALDMTIIARLIETSAEIKAAIVADDTHEAGQRALLNLGHTFAHAIETIVELDVRHGEAVAIGLRGASHLAIATGRMTSHEAHTVHEVIAHCGLPCRLPHPVAVDRLLESMSFDKKSHAGAFRLVMPLGIGRAEIVDDVPPALVREAWLDLGAAG